MEIPHKDDAKWYEKQIARLPYSLREKAVDGYRHAFVSAYENESADHKKENKGRFAANKRLLFFVKRVTQKSPS